ncbi:drug/metabolite transporter (DMT) superfamily permease [Streptococcus sp. GMD6S]|nr:drug/metabolite transporter (DMT) superfamily permease [Streptococcus sp. GMD6S]
MAGIAWGLSGTSGQYLMAHGISALVLTDLRLLIAGGGYSWSWLILLERIKRWPF